MTSVYLIIQPDRFMAHLWEQERRCHWLDRVKSRRCPLCKHCQVGATSGVSVAAGLATTGIRASRGRCYIWTWCCMLLSLPSVSAGYVLYFRSVSGLLACAGAVRRQELFKSVYLERFSTYMTAHGSFLWQRCIFSLVHTLGRVRYLVHPSWWGWNRVYIPCICWCYLGAPRTRRALGPPSTASHTPDRTHVKLGDSWLVNNLEGGAAERASQMARQEELNPREGRINLDRLSRGNLDSPLWENVQTCSSAASVSLLLLNQLTGFPTGFFITGS